MPSQNPETHNFTYAWSFSFFNGRGGGRTSGSGFHDCPPEQALPQLSNWSSAANQTTMQGPNGNCYRVKPGPCENLTRGGFGLSKQIMVVGAGGTRNE